MLKSLQNIRLPVHFAQRHLSIVSYKNKEQPSTATYRKTQLLDPRTNFPIRQQVNVRFKYDKKGKSAQESDSDEEEFTNDFAKDKSLMKTTVGSMRADLIIKAGLGLARNKVEVKFYENKIRVNGKRIDKKSAQLYLGDEIDVIKGVSPNNSDHLVVGRLEIVSASPKEESISLVLRRFKTLIIENYPGADFYKGSPDDNV